jgi:flagellar motor protein MotB
MSTFTKKIQSVLLMGLAIFSTGCASQQRLAEYQSEVLSLREERAELKKQNSQLRQENQGLEVALMDASSVKPMAVQAAPNDEPSYSTLDALGIPYHTEGTNLVIAVPSSITFSSGQAELTKQGKSALQEVAKILKEQHAGSSFWIEGHTDSDPIRKSPWASNRDLSVNRAMAVLHYFVDKCEIKDEECVVAGHGEYRAVDAGSSKEAKAKNRRVEIVVHK